MTSRSRFSHRHLIALSTFLVPLVILALLGRSELQRSGALADMALAREGRQFLESARQAIEQQLEQHVAPLLSASQDLIPEYGPVRTVLLLRQDPEHSALRSILMLDEQADLIWPTLPQTPISLPFARDAHRNSENPARAALAAADALLTRGEWEAAITLLHQLVADLETANPPNRDRRPELEEIEMMARFRLATALRRQQQFEPAQKQLENVQRLAGLGRGWRSDTNVASLGFLAESLLAEMGSPEQRLDLLQDIAEGRRDQADGLSGAIAARLSATFPRDAAERITVDKLLRENAQRAATRRFAEGYELVLKYGLKLRQQRRASMVETTPAYDRMVSTMAGETVLVCVRPATEAESRTWKCAAVGLHLDLGELLLPVLPPFAAPGGTFVLAVHDPDDVAIVPAPSPVPPEFEAPMLETSSLTLRAFPADPARLVADAEAAIQQRTLLLVALIVAALGGALWSWRSVSRETELAALKIDLVSRVSHELKTPLALIRMYGETLGMGRARDPNQAAEFGSIIARESSRLTTLIQRILDFSRQQAGTLHYAPHRHDLGDLLRSIANAYAPHLEARGVLLIDELPAGIVVECDANACESAIVNLLENAAKYGPDGDEHEVELVLRADDGAAVIEVRDRGRGIPLDERERVFEGFYRASNSGEVRGAGLGLSLVRHFAHAHGGQIQVLDHEGGGTIMRLVLPLAATAASTTGSGTADGNAPANSRTQDNVSTRS